MHDEKQNIVPVKPKKGDFALTMGSSLLLVRAFQMSAVGVMACLFWTALLGFLHISGVSSVNETAADLTLASSASSALASWDGSSTPQEDYEDETRGAKIAIALSLAMTGVGLIVLCVIGAIIFCRPAASQATVVPNDSEPEHQS